MELFIHVESSTEMSHKMLGADTVVTELKKSQPDHYHHHVILIITNQTRNTGIEIRDSDADVNQCI